MLKEGEHFSLLIENAGPGGMYTEIARTMVLGKATNDLLDGFETREGSAGAHAVDDQARRPGARHRPRL